FIDPKAEVAEPNARAEIEGTDDADPGDDEHSGREAAAGTGPDPEEDAKRLKTLKKLHKKYVATLVAHGLRHSGTNEAPNAFTTGACLARTSSRASRRTRRTSNGSTSTFARSVSTRRSSRS